MLKSPPSWAVEALLPTVQQHIGALIAPFLSSSGHPPGCLLAGSHAALHSACCSSGCSIPRTQAAPPAQLQILRSQPDAVTMFGQWRVVLQESKLQLAQHVEPRQQVARQQQHSSAAGPSSIWTQHSATLASHKHPAGSILSGHTSCSCHTRGMSNHSSCRTYGSMTHGGGSHRGGDRRTRGSAHSGDSGVDEVEELQHSNRRRIQRSITRCKSLSQVRDIGFSSIKCWKYLTKVGGIAGCLETACK